MSAGGRRALLRTLLALPGGALLGPRPAWAGGQIEEPLADSVRTALSAAIANDAPPVPSFSSSSWEAPSLVNLSNSLVNLFLSTRTK